MNKIEKYDYENIKEELKKSKYIVYLVYVDTNKPKEYEYYKKILSFNGSHKELIKYLEKEYKNLNKQSFFIVYKFSFHTGKKPLQGGPLSITISSLVKEIFFNKIKNEYDTNLVSGYTKDNKYKKFHGKVWFQRKYLNINGWSDDYLDCMTEGLLSGKVKLLPLVVNMFNVDFGDICEKRKKKNTNEIYKLIDQLKKTEINKPTDTKEIEEKFKEIESLSKPTNINDLLKIIKDIKKTKIKNKNDIDNLLYPQQLDEDEINFLIEYDKIFNELNNILNSSKPKLKPNLTKKYIENLNNLDDFNLNFGLNYNEPKKQLIKSTKINDEKDWTDIYGGKRKKKLKKNNI
jgi:hypothetical protein